ncbi:hypothetical protein Gbem_0455 [Citrifermentans bemidjiense Bem]|uniref:Uncharacterized protein n=2 Tax=Citrifermentans bemidjiense TaxID=225194 RepID=B5EBL5_CITBB|nr:hypothetical protein Gbem_0455 [Citrifermentans bemidjiense Bem]
MRITAAVITVLALAAVPCFAANGGATAGRAGGTGAAATIRQVPPGQQMNQEMMPTPAHLLMRAYHRNVANFAQTLYQAADQGPVVQPSLARTAVSEMRRSVDEMEKQRATALGAMRLPPERQKMMDEHLVQVKTHLRQLEEMVQKERIDSGLVKKELQSIFVECDGAGCCARPSPVGRGRQGKGPYGGRPGCDCPKGNPDHAMMMDDMMEKVKSQDAELAQLVQRMRQADGQAKLDLVAETVATMVQQRAELTADMQKMHDMMQGEYPGSDQMLNDDEDQDQGGDEEYDFEDEEDVTAD